MARRGDNWTREQLLRALVLYREIPVGKIRDTHPRIKELAEIIGRSPGAVKAKIFNFAHIDPDLEWAGMSSVSRLDRSVWEEYYEKWRAGKWIEVIHELERPFLQDRVQELRQEYDPDDLPSDTELEAVAKRRKGQDSFSNMVLAAYEERCCLTELPIRKLLNASHIVPWAEREDTRLNPSNGLCLNALHDRAFDRGLITLDNDCRVVVSPQIDEFKKDGKQAIADLILRYEDWRIRMPERHPPSQEFLEYHRTKIFRA